eukprot:TRINITY_DN209_c0_g1_i3.p2 TRINITY_DN209_c0_g1~~TRINITY_DN209_c0_g1_i3.p2  ORF type:complete len:458 (-),score=62.89 TRINITY_DN209_c0_g1_i3:2103-3476(-)
MAELNVPAPPSPSENAELRTNFKLLELTQKREKLTDLCDQFDDRRLQQKKQKKFWRVILESKAAGSPQLSGKEIFAATAAMVMKVLDLKSFDDQKVKARCFEFSLPKDRFLEKKIRKFVAKVNVNDQTYVYTGIIVPANYYRLVLTGPGVTTAFKLLQPIIEEAWATTCTAPTLEQEKNKEKLSMTCIFVTSKSGIPPQALLIYFATPELSKAGIYARWTQADICNTCGNAGHEQKFCAFADCPEEAAWMFDLTSKHADYHERQLKFIIKRQATRLFMSSPPDFNPLPSPSPVSPPQRTPPLAPTSLSAPLTSSPKETPPGITQGTTTQSTNLLNQSTPPPTAPTSNSTLPHNSWTYAEVAKRIRPGFRSGISTQNLPVDPSIRRSSLATTKEEIFKKSIEESRERWILSKSTTENNSRRTDQSSSSSSSSSSPATHSNQDSLLLASPGGPTESSSL